MIVEKKCRKCGEVYPATADFFYRHPSGKHGVTPRCKPCVNEDNKEGHAKRMARDPDAIRAQALERTKRWYRKDVDHARRISRESAERARKDPQKNERIKARKRGGGAGLTPERLAEMLEEQGGACAICESTDPGSKLGWNVDHCHTTKDVRFILCSHCNRGLGAFKDSPDFMRKAANMLEAFFQSQADDRVAAIMMED